jgi:hypothetical protein
MDAKKLRNTFIPKLDKLPKLLYILCDYALSSASALRISQVFSSLLLLPGTVAATTATASAAAAVVLLSED